MLKVHIFESVLWECCYIPRLLHAGYKKYGKINSSQSKTTAASTNIIFLLFYYFSLLNL